MAPTHMKAIKIVDGNKAELQDVPVPQLRDDYVLIKVKSVALNPTDWKHIDKIGVPGPTVGCDVCGIVEEVGKDVTKDWRKGDRIATFTHGSNGSQHEDGCFAEYCVAKGDVGMKVPDGMSDDDAATLGVGVITVGQSMYQGLDLPLPGDGRDTHGAYFLVYGGSTATGTLAIQYAVLSGYKVVTTASERNWPLLKALGAEKAFDYKDPDCGKKIREYTNNSLTLALDCVAEGDTPAICGEAISSEGGAIAYLLATAKHTRDDVRHTKALGYTIIGEAFEKFGKHVPAKPEDFEYAKRFCAFTQKLLDADQLATHPTKVGKDGLVGVFDGLQQMREGKVSGVKLVYRVADTPA